MRNLRYLTISEFLGWSRNQNRRLIDERRGYVVQNLNMSKVTGSLVKAFGYELAGDVIGAAYVTDSSAYLSDGVSANIGNIANFYNWKTAASDLFVIHTASDSVDSIRYWNNSAAQWDQLDDDKVHHYTKARFITRDDALIIAAGTAATDYPVYIKYMPAATKFGAESYAAGFYSGDNHLPFDANIGLTVSAVAVNTDQFDYFDTGYFGYYLDLTYDESQNGDLSELKQISYGLNDTLHYSRKLLVAITTDNAAQGTFNDRVTHINIYRDNIDNYDPTGSGFNIENALHLCKIPIKNATTDETDLMPVYAKGYVDLTAGVGAIDTDNQFPANDCFNSLFMKLSDSNGDVVAYAQILDGTTDSVTLVTDGAEGTYDSDGNYYYNVVPRWYTLAGITYNCFVFDGGYNALSMSAPVYRGHDYATIPKYNYKYHIVHKNRQYIANLYDVADGSLHKNWLAVSGISGEGNYMYDVYPIVISLSDYGINEINGIGRIQDFIIIFGDNDILKLNVSGGSEFEWSIEETLQNVGCVSPDSIIYIMSDEYVNSGYFYMAYDGVRVFDGYKSTVISGAIHDPNDFPFNTTLTNAKFGYDPVSKQLRVETGDGGIRFIYNLLNGEWTNVSGGALISNFITTNSGRLLGNTVVSANKIYVYTYDGSSYLTSFDGTGITPLWQSKTFDFGAPGIDKILHEVTIRYRSDSGINFNWYRDSATTSDDLNGTPFTDNTAITSVTAGFPIGTRGNEFSFYISAINSDDSNFQIDSISIGYSLAHSERFE